MIDYIDLGGEWEYFGAEGSDKLLPNVKPEFDDTIYLPGTTSLGKKGSGNAPHETGCLTDPYKFEGTAWFRRRITLSDIEGKRFILFLERTRKTAVYFDKKLIGTRESLVEPHIYELTRSVSPGEHELMIAVCNIGYKTGGGHLTSRDTQTNWCGITGKIQLRIFGREIIDKVRVFPDADAMIVRVTGEILNRGCSTVSCSIETAEGSAFAEQRVFPVKNGKFDFKYKLATAPALWSDEDPRLYTLSLYAGMDYYSCSFGFRKFETQGRKLILNGRRIFLRGKHDGMIFPLTGFAPTDTESWLGVMTVAKSYGINHYRFHTCCPPEAAFEAADRLGIIMEPEISFWGTLRDREDPQYNAEEQTFLREEGLRILDAFGNHPSFCILSLGNELWGSEKMMNEIIKEYRDHDPRHLYTQGSNNFQFMPRVLDEDDLFVGVRLGRDRLLRGSYAMCDAPLGHIQKDKPSTMHDYSEAIIPHSAHNNDAEMGGSVQIQFGTGVKTVEASAADGELIPDVPVITHEIGQYETYPNIDELEKYVGVLKPYNLEAAFDKLDKAGLKHLAKDLFLCSGKLSAACYKEELEAALRTEELSGFQLLDLQDFSGQGTALVGMLDAFMESKGLIAPEKWRQFCADTVILARFADYCLEGGSCFEADVQLVSFASDSFDGRNVSWSLKGEGVDENGGFIVSGIGDHRLLGRITVSLPEVERPVKLMLNLSVEWTDISNSYELMLFPSKESVGLPEIKVFRELDAEAEELLKAGKNVLLLPKLDESNSVEGTYCTDFWCYPMFRSISESMGKPLPVGTCGLLIDNGHPALSGFPCEKWTTPQWWEIVSSSRSEIVRSAELDPKINVIIRTIDNFSRCLDLALLYEYELYSGKVIVCGCDIEKIAGSPEGRAFISSLAAYVENKKI